MVIKHNIPIWRITWLSASYDRNKSTGGIETYYIPDNRHEPVSLCRDLYRKNLIFFIIGHTSNIYIRPNTNIKHLISTRKLTKWSETGEFVYSECGVHVKKLAKSMIGQGVKGFAALIDLPGTVGGAIYGNAGVGKTLFSDNLLEIEILCEDGIIRKYSKKDMAFAERESILKQHELNGVILACKLQKTYGDKHLIKKEAQLVHEWRKTYQPGPSHNLGTTSLFCSNCTTFYGFVVLTLSKTVNLFKPKETITERVLMITGHQSLKRYLFGLNRFMWKDEKAHELFGEYIKLLNRLYSKTKLEIEVW